MFKVNNKDTRTASLMLFKWKQPSVTLGQSNSEQIKKFDSCKINFTRST